MFKQLLTVFVIFIGVSLGVCEYAFAHINVIWTKTYGNPSAAAGLEVTLTKLSEDYSEPAGFRISSEYHTKSIAPRNATWVKTLGGPTFESGRTTLQQPDGGSLIAGYVRVRLHDYEVYVIRTDADGGTSWTKTFSTTGSSKQHVVTGWTLSFSAGGSEVYLMRLAPADANLEQSHNNTVKEFQLAQNYPNPFNPSTKISYAISEPSFVRLKIYNIRGREVQVLINEVQEAGIYSIDFDGRTLASGFYFYKLEAGKFVETKKMLLIR